MLIRNCFRVCSLLSFDGILVRKTSLPFSSEPSSRVILKLVLRKMIGSLWDDHWCASCLWGKDGFFQSCPSLPHCQRNHCDRKTRWNNNHRVRAKSYMWKRKKHCTNVFKGRLHSAMGISFHLPQRSLNGFSSTL